MAIQVTNTSAQLAGKTLLDAEDAQTITAAKTFALSPAAPFIVTGGSASVANLDADKVDGKHATDLLLLTGAQAMTGKLDLGTIGQIQFPAAQNASAGANVLDDFEKGTFTPTLISAGGGAPTYSTQLGLYVKIGPFVFCQVRLTISAFGTLGAGALTFGGLPVACNAIAHGSMHSGYAGTFVTSVSSIAGYVFANTTTIVPTLVVAAGSTATTQQWTKADITAAFDIIYTANYYSN